MDQVAEQADKTAQSNPKPVSREVLRQVVKQRQELKKELRALKESLATLPQDWPDRLRNWLDLETRAEAAGRGELVEAAVLEAERAGWAARERDFRQRLGELTLTQRLTEAAAREGAYDPADVVALTRELFQISFHNGQVHIGLGPETDQAGLAGENPEGTEPTLEEVVARFLEQKPHLVRAKTRPGSGARPELNRTTPTAALDPAELARLMLAQRQRLQGRPV